MHVINVTEIKNLHTVSINYGFSVQFICEPFQNKCNCLSLGNYMSSFSSNLT